jgi:hypothetical protein
VGPRQFDLTRRLSGGRGVPGGAGGGAGALTGRCRQSGSPGRPPKVAGRTGRAGDRSGRSGFPSTGPGRTRADSPREIVSLDRPHPNGERSGDVDSPGGGSPGRAGAARPGPEPWRTRASDRPGRATAAVGRDRAGYPFTGRR